MLTDGDDEKPEMTCGGIDGAVGLIFSACHHNPKEV